MVRPHEIYGDVRLSVQAGAYLYSDPPINGLDLKEYKTVEIALIGSEGHWLKPSDLNIEGFDELWNGDDVAGYVPQAKLKRLRAALRKYAKMAVIVNPEKEK